MTYRTLAIPAIQTGEAQVIYFVILDNGTSLQVKARSNSSTSADTLASELNSLPAE